MRRCLPSVTDLNAFEVAARHGSFTQAAQALCITQGAVSKQIRQLEEFLGVELFVRTRQGLVLTSAGHSYLDDVKAALGRLEAASLSLMTHKGLGGTLNITCMPSFGAQWLIPRLSALRHQYPDLHIGFLHHRMGYDFTSPDVDAAIRFGPGAWPGAHADYLLGRAVVPVACPELVPCVPVTPEDLLNYPLLHHATSDHAWADWFEDAGHQTPRSREGARFDQYVLLIQAAMAGFGLALIPRCLIERELACGKLVALPTGPVQGRDGYYLCYPEHKSRLPALQAFRRWLLAQTAEVGADQAGGGGHGSGA